MRKFCLHIALLSSLALIAVERVDYAGRTYYVSGGEVIGFTDGVAEDSNLFALSDFFGCDRHKVHKNTNSEIINTVKQFQNQIVTDSIGPLLGNIEFNQGYPYNKYCPTLGNTRCPAGCVAVAMAQLMTYYQKPSTPCHGNVQYKSSTVNITIQDSYEGWIPQWENILSKYETDMYSDKQADAVADLCRKLGTSVHMDYNKTGSGTQSVKVPNAMRDYFNYDCDDLISKTGDVQWNRLMRSNLDEATPVYYASLDADQGGHAYICDGYYIKKGEESYPFYHFNFGWGGTSNGWFKLNNIHINKSGDEFNGEEMNFTSNQQAIFNLRPKIESGVVDVADECVSKRKF